MAATWSPFTPRWRPRWLDSPGRSLAERMRIGGVPIAPQARIRTLHSNWTLPFDCRLGLGPSLSIVEASTMYRYGRAELCLTDSTWMFGMTLAPRRSALAR